MQFLLSIVNLNVVFQTAFLFYFSQSQHIKKAFQPYHPDFLFLYLIPTLTFFFPFSCFTNRTLIIEQQYKDDLRKDKFLNDLIIEAIKAGNNEKALEYLEKDNERIEKALSD